MTDDRIFIDGEEAKVTQNGPGWELGPNGFQQRDPNADLVGFQYVTAEGTPAEETVTVVGTCDWSDQYVTVRFATGHETIKPVAVVRRRKEIDGA